MSTVSLTPGMLFAREYRVVRPLAEGGMGAVYVVEQLGTGELRALKTMHPGLLADAASRERFDREARVSGRIASQHAVKVIAAGVDEPTRTPFLCMELLDGEDLASRLRRGPLGSEASRVLFEQMCHALELAHRAGIVHRDLKPENVFLSKPLGPGAPFTVKILDFGIAKIFEDARASQGTTPIGTPLWMSPEQTDPHANIRPTTDVWALGLIAFTALTGRVFWLAGNIDGASLSAVLAELINAELPLASVRAAELGVSGALPHGFDAFFARCVDRSPSRRFEDAGQVRDAFLSLGHGVPTADHAAFSSGPSRDVAGTTSLAPPATLAPSTGSRAPIFAVVLAIGLGLPILLCGVVGIAMVLRDDETIQETSRQADEDTVPSVDPRTETPSSEPASCRRSADCADPLRERCTDGTCEAAPHWADVRIRYGEGVAERRLRSTQLTNYTASAQGNFFTYNYGPTWFSLVIPTGTQPGVVTLEWGRPGAMLMFSESDAAAPPPLRGYYDHQSGTINITEIAEGPNGVVRGTIEAVLAQRSHPELRIEISVTFQGTFESVSE